MAQTAKIYLDVDFHPGQREVFESPARFRVLDCGRRWGKTTVAKAEIYDGASKSERVAYMCPTNKMLSEMWRAVKNDLAPITEDKNEQEHRIATTNDAVIDFWSLDNPDGPRGREYNRIIVDEAAVLPTGDIWQEVIRPTLMSTQGRALFASTPKGYNWFWGLYQLGMSEHESEWAAWKKPTADNPHIPRNEIESARRTTPVNIFSQEYEAEFISDSGSVFRQLETAAISYWQKGPIEGHSYVIGVDLAKTNDFSVFTVIDVTLMAVCHIDRANHVDYKLQRGRLIALAELFKAVKVVVEQNTNLAFMEGLMDTGLPIMPFITGGTSKALIIEGLAGAFDNQRLLLLDKRERYAQQMLDELHAFQMERLPSGAFRYAGPRDAHDDMVMSLAMAYHGATYGVARWDPEIIEIGRPNRPLIMKGAVLGPREFPPPPPEEVAWPTAEYIFR